MFREKFHDARVTFVFCASIAATGDSFSNICYTIPTYYINTLYTVHVGTAFSGPEYDMVNEWPENFVN